jgi:hypothetical protein
LFAYDSDDNESNNSFNRMKMKPNSSSESSDECDDGLSQKIAFLHKVLFSYLMKQLYDELN